MLQDQRVSRFAILFWIQFSAGLIPAYSQERSFRNLTTSDGLPSATIYSVFQDSQGLMWFASDNGVARYDGYNFTLYTTRDGLADNEIFDFYEDSKGRIWFQSFSGSPSYYHKDTIYNSSNTPELEQLSFSSYITSMDEDTVSQAMWIASVSDGIVQYKTDGEVKKTTIDPNVGDVSKVVVTNPGQAIIVARLGVFEVRQKPDSKVLELVRKDFALDTVLNKARTLFADNRLYFSDRGDIYCLDVEKDSFSVALRNPSHVPINDLNYDNGGMWVCTTRGASFFSWEDQAIKTTVLPGQRTTSVLRDDEGNLWISTLDNGVYFQSRIAIYKTELPGITAIASDSAGTLWIASGDGRLYKRTDSGIVSDAILSPGLSEGLLSFLSESRLEIHSITFEGSTAWLASNLGLFRYRGKSRDYMPGKTQFRYVAKDGSIWLVYGNRLVVLPDNHYAKNSVSVFSNQFLVGTNSEIISYAVVKHRISSVVVLSSGELWAATNDTLYAIDPGSKTILRKTKIERGQRIVRMCELPNGDVILATVAGGLRAVTAKGEPRLIITADTGLPSNTCSSVICTEDNNLWVGTKKGVARITGYPDSIQVRTLDVDDGLLSNEIVDLLNSGDTIWVATKFGLNSFASRLDPVIRESRPFYLTSLKVNGEVWSSDRQPMLLEYNQRDISVSFALISFASHGRIVYRYRLSDESEWKYTQQTELNFASLEPSSYRLTIQGRNPSGEWSHPHILTFVIQGPWWRGLWFYIALAMAIAGLFVAVATAVFIRRKRKMIQENLLLMSEVRTLRAQVNPHFFFNVLNAIQGMLLRKETELSFEYLGKFAVLVRRMLDHSEESQICLADEIESLKTYLELERLRTNGHFAYSIHVDDSMDAHAVEIPIMILQPFVENSIRHGLQHRQKGGHVILSFVREGNYVRIMIEDDGIGRARAQALRGSRTTPSKGNSLITRRIHMLNRQLRRKIEFFVEDAKSDSEMPGTRVIFRFPI